MKGEHGHGVTSFIRPFMTKVGQKTTNFPEEVIYIISFDVARWKELAGLDS